MESSSEAMKAHMSDAAHARLCEENSKLKTTPRGMIDVKGKGEPACAQASARAMEGSLVVGRG